MKRHSIMLLSTLLFAYPAIGQPSLYSGFDSSIKGWTTTVGATAPVFSASGGNPGGFISATDTSGNPSFANFGWGFISPNSWDGDSIDAPPSSAHPTAFGLCRA